MAIRASWRHDRATCSLPWVLRCARRGQHTPCDLATYALRTKLVGGDEHVACGGVVGGELGEDRLGGHVRGVGGDLRHRQLGLEARLHSARLGWRLGRLGHLSVGSCSRAQHSVRGRSKNEKRKRARTSPPRGRSRSGRTSTFILARVLLARVRCVLLCLLGLVARRSRASCALCLQLILFGHRAAVHPPPGESVEPESPSPFCLASFACRNTCPWGIGGT